MAGNIVELKNVENGYRLRYKGETKNVKAKNHREAEKLLAAFVTEIDSGNHKKASVYIFGELVEHWLKEYPASNNLAPKTLHRYKERLNGRILPRFGKSKIEKLEPSDFTAFYNEMRGEHEFISIKKDGTTETKKSPGLTENGIKAYHILISLIFSWGVDMELITNNPTPGKRLSPKTVKSKVDVYDIKEINKMMKALENEELRYKLAVVLSLTSGARLGEMCGLTWKDIDLDNQTININKSSQYLPGKGVYLKPPKTEDSIRIVSIDKYTTDLIKEYKADQQAKGFLCADNNSLFVTWEGEPVIPTLFSKWFARFLQRHKLPHLKWHGLRHCSASILINSGDCNIKLISERLGHSKINTTLDVYGHLFIKADKKAADVMDDIFSVKNQAK